MASSLREIEKDFDINKVTVSGEKAWPILRYSYFDAIRPRTQTRKSGKKIFELLPESFYGFPNWFGKIDVICFSDSEQSTRRLINGEYFDRFIDPIIDMLSPKRCLLIEIPSPRHRSIKAIHTKRIVSSTLIEAFARLRVISENKIHIENKFVLEKIQRKYGVSINDEKILHTYQVKKNIYRILYQHLQPKIIFLVEYYHDIARIKAAKELHIPTIEVQHGIIGAEHPAYNSEKKIDDDYFPDQLLSFGEIEKQLANESFIYKPESIHPVGSFIIDYVNKIYKPDNNLVLEIRKYNKSIAVTLQKTMTDEIIRFIEEAAQLDRSILYLLVPRQEVKYSQPFHPNIRVIQDPNFYELMKYVDFHITAYSSCAIEAPSMGVRNILINIGGYAKAYYGNILHDKAVIKYVETPKDLVEQIRSIPPVDKNAVIEANSSIISPRYFINLKKYLRELQLIN